jgi:hypothetical protein
VLLEGVPASCGLGRRWKRHREELLFPLSALNITKECNEMFVYQRSIKSVFWQPFFGRLPPVLVTLLTVEEREVGVRGWAPGGLAGATRYETCPCQSVKGQRTNNKVFLSSPGGHIDW